MKKEIIISFILGAIISSVVGVIAASTISSSSVLYKNDKTVNNVLDELFENVDAIESDDTRLTSLEGRLNTLTSTHSSDITRIDNSIEEVNNDIKSFGKLLWQGNFTSGSITITGLSNYKFFAVNVGGVICFGNIYYGGNNLLGYGSYGIETIGYRLARDGDTLTIDEYAKGGSDGTKQLAITQIYGLF